MFSTEDLKTAIGATVIARRNAAARLREAGNPRDPFHALPGMEQQFFEAAQSVRSYDLVLNLLEREVKREARKRAGRTAQSAAAFLITAGLIILATLGFAAALLLIFPETDEGASFIVGWSWLLFGICFAGSVRKLNPILLILFSAVAGIAIYYVPTVV